MIWKFLKQNVLFPKGLNWVQHWVYSRIGLFASYLISFIIFSFSLKDQFLILLRSAAAAQKILEAQVFFEQNYFLRDQYTCLHTDHFIQLFNSTIKHKHLWRTFLALKITLIFNWNTLWEPLQRVVPMMTEKQAISFLFASRTPCNKFSLDLLWWLADYIVMP